MHLILAKGTLISLKGDVKKKWNTLIFDKEINGHFHLKTLVIVFRWATYKDFLMEKLYGDISVLITYFVTWVKINWA